MYKYFALCISFLSMSSYSMEYNMAFGDFATLHLNEKKAIFLVPNRYKEFIACGIQDTTLLNTINRFLKEHHKPEKQLPTEAFTVFEEIE